MIELEKILVFEGVVWMLVLDFLRRTFQAQGPILKTIGQFIVVYQ
jgi:hypothetical protein